MLALTEAPVMTPNSADFVFLCFLHFTFEQLWMLLLLTGRHEGAQLQGHEPAGLKGLVASALHSMRAQVSI